MLIAQITDLHVVDRGQKLAGVLDTNAMARAALAHLNTLVPRPDVVLVTGDLAEHGQASEYAVLRELLDGLVMPYYVIPGNHDRRTPLLAAFAAHAESSSSGFVQYALDRYPVRLVALDTLSEGRQDGLLCSARLTWLAETLAGAPDRPTLLFMHHPPFATGIWWLDTAGLVGAAALRQVVARHPQVGRIICGHIHRSIQTTWGGTLVTVAPSTAYQVHLDLGPERPPQCILEPPACQLHVFDGQGFVTHTSYVNWPQQPIDVSSFLGDWEAVKAERRARQTALPETARRDPRGAQAPWRRED